METKFLKDVQKAGWHIESASDDSVVGKCPSAGCQLRAKLAQGSQVPNVDPGRRRDVLDQKIEQYSDIQEILRLRRESLALSIREVEEIGGITVDLIAKAEKENPSKLPNVEMLINWAQALGFEIVFRPSEMTSLAMRTICETRDKTASRQKRYKVYDRRRGERSGSR